jgi:hypothetical protein
MDYKKALRAADALQQRHAWLAVPVAVWKKSGDVLGLIAWLCLVAELTLYAVEINVVRAYRLWPRSIAPPPYTEQDRRAFQLYAQVQERRKREDIEVAKTGGEKDRTQN